eukprot:gene31113-6245_t
MELRAYFPSHSSNSPRDPTQIHAGVKISNFRGANWTYAPQPQHEQPHGHFPPPALAAICGTHPDDHINNGDGLRGFPHGRPFLKEDFPHRRPFTEHVCMPRTPTRAGKINAAGAPVAGGKTDQTQGPMRQRGRGISLCTHRLIQDADEGGRKVVEMNLREDQSELLIELHYWLHEDTDENPDGELEDVNHYALE